MTHILKSHHLQFVLNPQKGTWSLYGNRPGAPSIEDAWMRVSYQMGFSSLFRTAKRKFQFVEKWYKPKISEKNIIDSPHGPMQQLTVEMGPDVNGIRYKIEFSLAADHPIFLWRIGLTNTGKHPASIEKIELLRAGFFPNRQILPNPGPLSMKVHTKPVGYGTVRPHPDPAELSFFSNGWQSWSYSGVYGPEEVYRGTQLDFLAAPMWYSNGKSPRRKPGIFTSDMFGILGDRQHRAGILAGFLSQKEHFGTLEASINDPLYPALALWADGDRAQLNPGAQMTTDWAVIQLVDIDHPDPLGPYLDAVARENDIPSSISNHRSSVGWCSWYHFFQDIDEPKMRANLETAIAIKDTVPLDLIQMDDGFETQIGDWFDFSPGFPVGVAPLAADIKTAGFTPGLWLAPFIVHSRSKLAKKRKWLLRNRWGIPVNAGFIWNNFNTALDLTHPAALEYAKDAVRTAAHDWGYPYLKLDFLYAAAVKTASYQDKTKTRAQVLRMGLEAIREAVGAQVILLGCGVPLGPSIGIFDAMRIGADVAPSWKPEWNGRPFLFSREPNFPSVRNALQNIFSRAAFHNRWWINDPDCLLIRPESNLTLAEVQTLATAIAITGGALLFSDDLPNLPADRLRIAGSLIPLIGKTPQIPDWFDSGQPALVWLDIENVTGREWHLLAVFNWEAAEKDVDVSLEKAGFRQEKYFSREFWTGESALISGGRLNLKGIPPHGVRLISLSPATLAEPLYIGSDLHISQGLEVTEWVLSPTNGVRFKIERPGKSQGEIELYLPEPPKNVILNKKEILWHELGGNRYRIDLQFEQIAEIEIV